MVENLRYFASVLGIGPATVDRVVTDGSPAELRARSGTADLEDVYLQLVEERLP